MNKEITLEELAKSMHTIFVDGTIYDKDISTSSTENGTYSGEGFIAQSYNAIRFGGEDLFLRQEVYIGGIFECLKNNENIHSPPSILREYKYFIKLIRKQVLFLRNNKIRPNLLESLEKILEGHKMVLNLLTDRVQTDTSDKFSLAYFLLQNKFHKPCSGYFKKRRLIEETSEADAQLVSFAVDEAMIRHEPVAILTNDLDIPNMLYNLVLSDGGELGREIDVSVYFPSYKLWPGNFDLELITNSKGYAHRDLKAYSK
ncbi:MAG: hypothetical protein Q8R18_05520 [bacterium]|nr:hypothetical protein [bacterium]